MFKFELPEAVKTIFDIAKEREVELFLVGGCVRDSLLNKVPNDYDFCTSLPPLEIIEMFEEEGYEVIPTGLKHGTVTVVKDEHVFEITTYRKDSDYSDGRRPDSVEFTSSLEEDLSRRDFTINAMAYNPNVGIVDPFCGREDLVRKAIRAVGKADDRLREDFLRAMRAVRFSAQLGFLIDKELSIAISNNIELVENVSMERMQEEFCKTILSPEIESPFILASLLDNIVPEFKKSLYTSQNNPYHNYTVGTHTIIAIEELKDENIHLKLSAFFHDLGKVYTKTTDDNGIDHFYGHAEKSYEIAIRVMKTLKFSNDTIDKVSRLVLHHDREIDTTEKSVRRAINKVGADIFPDLMMLKVADISAQNLDYFEERIKKIDEILYLYCKIIEEKQCFSVKDLKVGGNDLITVLGLKQGKVVGDLLNYLLELVIDNSELNEYDALLDIAYRDFYGVERR